MTLQPTTTHAAAVSPTISVSVELPPTWARSRDRFPRDVLAVFTDERSLDPAFETSVILTCSPAEALDTWQEDVRATRLATLPDVQILDDRELDEAPGIWYSALMTTDATQSTILVRAWATVADELGLTLTLTTLPHIDAAHARILDAIAPTWSLMDSEPDEEDAS